MPEKTRAEFEEALENFRATAEAVVREHFVRNDYTFAKPNVVILSRGRKYVKLARTESDPETGENRGQTMVHCFVEIETGSIFKPASYKAPAKHARGCIYTSDHGRESMSPEGHIHYMR
jgi:hypothetical protein